MSGYIQAIRPPVRTIAYSHIKAQPVSAYASYPYREGKTPLLLNNENAWRHPFQQAADGAAEWVKTVKQAQYTIDETIWNLSAQSRDASSLQQVTVIQSVHIINELINNLESVYKQYETVLKPELWQKIEHELQHPNATAFNIHRSHANGLWTISDSPIDDLSDELLKRLLLGTDGLLNHLKQALAFTDKLKAADLLQLNYKTTLPYSAYYGAIQFYFPLPSKGVILNQYI